MLRTLSLFAASVAAALLMAPPASADECGCGGADRHGQRDAHNRRGALIDVDARAGGGRGGLLGLGANVGADANGRGGLLTLDANVAARRGGLLNLDIAAGRRGGLLDLDAAIGARRHGGAIDLDVRALQGGVGN